MAKPTDAFSLTVASSLHNCVSFCLVYQYGLMHEMDCGYPFQNYCYCATAPESFSRALSYISSCASGRCYAGDVTHDLPIMLSTYTSYCYANGFTGLTLAPGHTQPPGPMPGPPATTESGPTITQVIYTTQTESADSSATPSQGKCLLLSLLVWLVLLL
jgi:hypothetical protein